MTRSGAWRLAAFACALGLAGCARCGADEPPLMKEGAGASRESPSPVGAGAATESRGAQQDRTGGPRPGEPPVEPPRPDVPPPPEVALEAPPPPPEEVSTIPHTPPVVPPEGFRTLPIVPVETPRTAEPATAAAEDLAGGSGAAARAGSKVTVSYVGRVGDAPKVVDRAERRTVELGAGALMQGLDEGIRGMKAGGKRRVVVPSHLLIGPRPTGVELPPLTPMTYEVEVHAVD